MMPRISRLFPLLFFACLVAIPAKAADCWETTDIRPLEILFWDTRAKLCGYQNMERIWSANPVPRGAMPAGTLPVAKSARPPGLKTAEFMQKNSVYGLLILHKGVIIEERYRAGFDRDKRWTSFSMAKSLTGLLVGAAVADGSIRSLDDKVAAYLPELAHGAYAPVTVRQILTMTSGVAWNEDYRDPKSDVATLADIAGSSEKSFLAYMASRPRKADPGTVFTYSTGEACIIGHLVRRATGKALAAYMAEKIWSRLGMEHDAIWVTDRSGAEVSGCCFSATLRDYARIGQFMLDEGRSNGRRILPPGWMRQMTTASAPSKKQGRPYGFQIWLRHDGSYQASGVFGQMIRVDPQRELVIVMLSAWDDALGTKAQRKERRDFIARVLEKL